jgi:uncharacterized protein YjbK
LANGEHVKVERETKLVLDAADFQRLLTLCTVRKCTDQLNVYYDHRGMLARAGATCRIRLARGAPATMTLKLPGQWSGTRRDAPEIEAELDARPSRSTPLRRMDPGDTPAEVAACLERLGVPHLERLGWLRNSRWHVSLQGLDFELDRAALPDGSTLFEVEIESDDAHRHERVVQLLAGLVPSARPSKTSKFERFSATIRRRPHR